MMKLLVALAALGVLLVSVDATGKATGPKMGSKKPDYKTTMDKPEYTPPAEEPEYTPSAEEPEYTPTGDVPDYKSMKDKSDYNSTTDKPGVKSKICFQKVTKCCYKYRKCGYVQNKIPVKERCDFKKCKNVCRNICKNKCETVCKDHCTPVCKEVCRYVKERVPKKVCKPVLKWKCEKVKSKYGVWYPKCKWVKSGEKCETKYDYIWKKRCKRECKQDCQKKCCKKCTPICYQKCDKVCHNVKAICHYYRIVKSPKYCPELKCEKEVVVGEQRKPSVIVSKVAIFVSKTSPTREIIGKIPNKGCQYK